MQTRFSKISNTILKYAILFTIPFLWLNYLGMKNLEAIAISVAISAGVGWIIALISDKKHIKTEHKKEQCEKVEKISLQFLYSSKQKTMEFFEKMFSKNYAVKKYNNYLKLNDTIFVPYYDDAVLKSADIYKILKFSDMPIVVACVCLDDSAKKICNSTNREIRVLDEFTTYKMLEKYNTFPDFAVEKKPRKKYSFIELKSIAFSRKNTKNYLIYSVILIVSSLFLRLNIYYAVFSTLLLIFAGISLFPKTETSDEKLL